LTERGVARHAAGTPSPGTTPRGGSAFPVEAAILPERASARGLRRLPLLVQGPAALVVLFELRAGVHARAEPRRTDHVEERVLEAEEEAIPESEAVLTAGLRQRRLGLPVGFRIMLALRVVDGAGLLGVAPPRRARTAGRARVVWHEWLLL